MQTNKSVPGIHSISELSTELAKRGLECNLITKDGTEKSNQTMYDKLNTIISEAYKRDDLTSEHLKMETWAVTLGKVDEPQTIVACCTLSFYSGFPSFFQVF